MAVNRSDTVRQRRYLRLECLIGREVRAANNRVIGRLQEVRVERRGRDYVVEEYVIGAAGLLERLGLGIRHLFGATRSGYVARWDQLDVGDAEHPRLVCPLADLTRVS